MSDDKGRHQRIARLFNQAADLPREEQLEFLKRECGEDQELLREVLSLLEYAADDILERRAQHGAREILSTTKAASTSKTERIGPYRLVRLLGRGGMGEVYLARQESPIHRAVAIKLIRVGMNTRDVVARFDAERQALALMDHPTIAKVFDAGSAPDGSPYFAMEYVPGLSIVAYCDRHRLSTRERLELFRLVCEGVQHAHQKAVIHRDLKPSNILVREVDGKPFPKIIDFGVAKAIAHRLTEHTVFTQVGVLIGTPEYMSPEQADLNQEDVDTRTDVYSLGVILYEMLVGALPFEPDELRRAGFDAIRRMIRERDPPRPSAKLSKLGDRASVIAANRRTEPRRLLASVRGELDWILMKALEKERSRRYGSPHEMATDLERHLHNEPVLAGPPTAGYRIRKFIRRNRAGVVAAFTAVLMLALFAVVAGLQAVRIAQERDRAVANELLAHGRTHAEKDPTAAVAYALASLEIRDDVRARELVADVLASHTLRRRMPIQGPRNACCVDISPDGRYCAVGWTREGTATLTNLADFKTRDLVGKGWWMVHDVNFSSDGVYLATAALDSLVRLWSVRDASLVGTVSMPGLAEVHPVRDPGRMIATVQGRGQPPILFEISLPSLNVTELGALFGTGDPEVGWFGAVDPLGRWIADCVENRIVILPLDDVGRGPLIELEVHSAEVSRLAFDPDGRFLASRDRAGRICVWELSGVTPILRREMEVEPEWEPTDRVLLFDPYRPRLLAASGRRILVWDLESPRVAMPRELIDRGHWVHAAAFCPDGSLISCRNGCGLAHWPIGSERFTTYDAREIRLGRYQLSNDGAWLYCWCGETLTAFPVGSDAEADIEVLPVEEASAWRPRAAGDEQHALFLASYLSHTGDISVVDVPDRRYRCFPAFGAQTICTCTLPSGRELIALGIDSYEDPGLKLRICDLVTGSMRPLQIDSLQTLVHLIAVADDTLALMFRDHLALYALSSGSKQTVWQGALGSNTAVDLGDELAVVLADLSLVLLNKRTGAVRPVDKVPNARLLAADVCKKRRLLATVGIGWGFVSVFSLDTGDEVRLRGQSSGWGNFGAHFDPHARWLLTRGERSLRKWPLPLEPSVEFMAHEDLVAHLRSLTNVRIVPDETKPEGYGLSYAY